MAIISVTRRWSSAERGEMSSTDPQEWRPAPTIYCPRCGQQSLWEDWSTYHTEDNAGACYVCVQCGHSFHYTDPAKDYIDAQETQEIIAGVRS